MIDCKPESLFTWNYIVRIPSTGAVKVTFDWLTEQGRIDGILGHFEVKKHGMMSGQWTLEEKRSVVCEAKKHGWSRVFQIRHGDQHLTLQAASPFTRVFQILEKGRSIGTISPLHPFTRHATVQCTDRIPEPVQLFCFWLTAMSWRRNQNNNST